MARPAVGTVVRRTTKRGTTYGLKVTWLDPSTGVTERVPVHLGGEWEGWTEERVQQERELIAALIARGEWLPPSRKAPPKAAGVATTPSADPFQVAASRHFDRRKRRMDSDKSRDDLRWRLSVAIAHLGNQPVDAITTGDLDQMVDALLRERDEIRKAREAGAPLMETVTDKRGRTYERQRRGLSNSSINKVVRAVKSVLDDAVRQRVVDRNEAADPKILVREPKPSRSFLEPFQIVALHNAAAELERAARGLTWDDVLAIRASTESAVALARRYKVSDALIGKVRRREVWTTEAVRRRNDVPRVVLVVTLTLLGLRISELCALDGDDLDFAGGRVYVPRMRRNDAGDLVRVEGIKTDAAERVIHMLPTARELLLDHKAEFGFGPKDPVFATRNGRRNTVDNVRSTIVDPCVAKANELLASRGQRQIVRCTPHTLRRTFASILAEADVPTRRCMYLLGHTNAKLTLEVYEQVLDMGGEGVETLEAVIGCSLAEAKTLLSGRGVLSPNRPPSKKKAPQRSGSPMLQGPDSV